MSIVLLLLLSASALTYRLLWRRRHGARGALGCTARLRGRLVGPGLPGELLWQRGKRALPPRLVVRVGDAPHDVRPSPTHLVVHARQLRVGDRVAIDGVPLPAAVEERSYREVGLRQATLALRLTTRPWPRLRWLDAAALAGLLGAALLGVLGVRDGRSWMAPLPCPAGTHLTRSSDPPSQWCERQGVREGPFESWWDPFQRLEAGRYAAGERSGTWLRWYAGGVLAARTGYDGGRFDGEHARWSPHGVLVERGVHTGGSRFVFDAFTDEGRLVWRFDRRQGLEASWHPVTGELRQLRRGHAFRAWDHGSLAEAGELDGAMKVGTWSRWDRGVLRSRGSLVEGQREGTWQTWHDDGSLASRGSYRCGKAEGTWRYYHPGGRLAATGAYHAGRASGRWLSWHKNGRLRRIATYDEGVPVVWREWRRRGLEHRGASTAEGTWEETLGERGLRGLTLTFDR